jgi:hypothetical protein
VLFEKASFFLSTYLNTTLVLSKLVLIIVNIIQPILSHMKKILLSFGIILSGISFGQRTATVPQLAESNNLTPKTAVNPLEDRVKTMLCVDTVRYPQVKEQYLNATPTFYFLDIWAGDNEGLSQTFLHSGATMSISGIEFFGRVSNEFPSASITVRASIYAVNASNVPTTQLATGTVTITSLTANYHYVNFTSPINVTGNYAVVIEPTAGVLDIWLNNITPGQPQDENLARYKSSFYASSGGNWVPTQNFTELGGSFHFEPLVAPLVSYTINTSGTVNPASVCAGTPVNFTNNTTPASILSNRMFSFNKMAQHFNVATSDSTFVWDMINDGPYVWNGNTSYTYNTPGTYNPALITLGGFWNSCVDFEVKTVIVNALPTVTAGATSTTICQGNSTTLNPSGASTYSWNNGIGAVESPVVSPTANTTYTVTGTGANGCTNTAQVAITVNPVLSAAFNYPTSTVCTSGGNVTPSFSNPGTFSSTAGLIFVSNTTGEIDVVGSTTGTYAITYTTSGTCPDVVSQNITLTDAADASFTYASGSFCSNQSNPSPVFTSGTAGVFSSTSGLSINASTGAINLVASTPGSYVVTNTIAAAGACPSDIQTFSVTINSAPSAAISGGGTVCGSGPVNIAIDLTGLGPWDITYSDGTNNTTLTNQSVSPINIPASSSGNYTIVSVSNSNCTGSTSGIATVVINANPTVTISPISDVCDNAASVTLVATPSGGSFTGTGIIGNQFDPQQGTGTYPVNYSFTDGNGCSGNASTTITVLESPTVTLAPLNDVCIENGSVTLTEGSPSGGVFSGNNVGGSSFDAPSAGVGNHTITYTYAASNGCSSAATQNITVEECLGLSEIANFSISIAPNPASEMLFITFDGTAEVSYTMHTEDGRVVVSNSQLSSNGTELNVRNFAAGIYFIHFSSNQGSMTKKVIIQ